MREKLKEFGKHSAVYGFGNALSAIGGFILIPFYTHMLVTSDYGILELLNRAADILIIIIMLGIRQAFIRFYFDDDSDDWHKTVLGTTIVFLLVSSAVVLILFWPIKEWVAEFLFDDPVVGVLFVYVLVWIPLDLIVQTGMTHLQIQMKSFTYVAINFFRFIAFIGSNVTLLYYFEMGIVGVLVTNIWISALIGMIFLVKIYKWTHVGIYALGFKLGFLGLALVMDPLGKIWSPFLFDNYNKEDGPRLISKIFTINALIGFTAALLISIGAPIVIPLITEQSYHSAYEVIPFVCLASVFWGLASMADYGVLIKKKTIYKPFIFGGAAIVAIISNLILVPLYSAIGAGIAVAIAYFSLLIINFYVSNRLYSIPIEFKKLLLIGFVTVFVYLISAYILNMGPDSLYYQGMSVLSFILYPVMLWMGGLLSVREKEILLMVINRKSKKAKQE